ncbi:Radial spoke head protein 4 A [Fasciolopsis buskii]|uniref:Radial spoke head protein 4 A n=1 Tax=Fasciolopsis buskii TaxID=27845 RepID=A0A8E0VH38_9TREM|nr:Radial spoke head protein 4 A [Fasciolopsis buski]
MAEQSDARKPFVDLGPELPTNEEFLRGKALLQSMHGGGPKMHDEGRESDPTTGNLYDHMVTLIKLILETQPTHALDQFEELSRQVKRERGGGVGGSGAGAGLVQEEIEAIAPTAKIDTPTYLHAKVERTLLHHPKHKWDEAPFVDTPLPAPWGGYYDDDEEIARLQNLGQTSFLVEQAGVGLGRTEMMRVWLSLRKLSLKLTTVVKLRFWGKILGTQGSYYIAEGEFEPGADPDGGVPGPFDAWRPYSVPKESEEPKKRENPEPFKTEDTNEQSEAQPENEIPVEQLKLMAARAAALENLPRNKWCPRAPIPPEPRGKGTNRWDYFACTRLGSDEWFRLPPARPEHIAHSRYIRRLFVGKPDAPVARSPGGLGDFPGLEVHLLRAHIARITAATWISPAGQYEIDEEAELEEGEQPETLMEVEEFEPPQFEELLDPANWQHTRPYILPQGRCSYVPQKRAANALRDALEEPSEQGWIDPTVARAWTNKFLAKEENEEAMEEEEGGDEGEVEIPEEGPGLLGTIEEDAALTAIGDVGLPTGRATQPKYLPIKLNSRPVPAWRVHPSTVLLPKNCSVAIVSSGRWPGAFTLCRGADFVNIYLGWGLKSLSAGFSPMWHANLMNEFDETSVPLIETTDPTPLEEEAVRAAKEARRLAREAKAEEEEEGAEEGEEEDEG